MHGWDVITDLVVLLSVASVLGVIAERIGLSSIVGAIVGGMLVGPGLLGWVHNDQFEVQYVAEFGVALLLFTIGLEITREKLIAFGLPGARAGILQVILTTVSAAAVANLLGWSWAASIAIGASICCSGVCLTVVEKGADWFAVEISGETISKTTLGQWRAGSKINLERALKVGDELGGHIVSGHVDGVGILSNSEAVGGSICMTIHAPDRLARLIAAKGSIAIDGVSLTVNEIDERRFTINIVSHTQEMTTLGGLKPGDSVNLEIDMLARYVARLRETEG